MRRLILLLSVLVFRLEASSFAYNSDNSLDDSPPVNGLNQLLSSISLEDGDDHAGNGDNDKFSIIEDNIGTSRAFMDRTPDSQVSSLTSSSSPETIKFTHRHEESNRQRGSSFHNHSNSAPKHVSFGWIQFSDDRWMPSEVMEDTEENRRHILTMMIADARHGNLEYFKYLAGVMRAFEARNPSNPFEQQQHELDFYNPNSLIFAAVHSDSVELFCLVMEMKGITFEELNPFFHLKLKKSSTEDNSSPNTFPAKISAFNSVDSDSDGEADNDDDDLLNADETVFGQAVIQNSISIVNLLLEHGVRDEYPEKSCTFLHLAIQHGHELLVRILLERGGSEIDRVDGALMPPLMIAIKTGHHKIVRLLLSLGASMFTTDFLQKNCLHHAAEIENKNLKTFKVLHEYFMRLPERQRKILINSEDVYQKVPGDYALDEPVVLRYYLKNFKK